MSLVVSKTRTPAWTQHLLRSLAYVALFVPFVLPPRGQTLLDTWTQDLNDAGKRGALTAEGLVCVLLHRRVRGGEEGVVHHALLHTVLSSSDNALAVQAPSMLQHGSVVVNSTAAFPYALPFVLAAAGAGRCLETLYDAVCGLTLHLPAYHDPHTAFSRSCATYTMHLWQQLLVQHPVPDPAFLAEAAGPLMALAAGWPQPFAGQARSLVMQLAKEQLAPGASALQALLAEFPLLALTAPAEESDAAAVWGDSQRTALLFFSQLDHGWSALRRQLDVAARGVPTCMAWDTALRRQVLLTAFALHTNAPPGVLQLLLDGASPGQLAMWAARAVAICLSVSPEQVTAAAEMCLVRGGTIQGVTPAEEEGDDPLEDIVGEATPVEEELQTLGRGVFANSGAAGVLGREAVPLQAVLNEHAARLAGMDALFGDMAQDAARPALGSSQWFDLPDAVFESGAGFTSPRPDLPAAGGEEGASGASGQLALAAWVGVPDLRLQFQPVLRPTDGLDRADLLLGKGSSAPATAGGHTGRLQAAAAAQAAPHLGQEGNIKDRALASPWPCLLHEVPLVGSAAEEQRILTAARRAAAVPAQFAAVDPALGLRPGRVARAAMAPVLRIVAGGDDACVHTVLAALMAAWGKAPQLFAVLDTQVFLLPSTEGDSVSRLAEYLAYVDPWYRRFAYGPFRGDTPVLPLAEQRLAAAAASVEPVGAIGPSTMHLPLLQQLLRSAHKRCAAVVWQVECWLPATAQAPARAGRVSAMAGRAAEGARGGGLREPSGLWQDGAAATSAPQRPADLLIPMFSSLELGVSVAAAKAQQRGRRTWWAAVAQALATGQSIATPELQVECTVRSVGGDGDGDEGALQSVLHTAAARYTSLRLDNCSRVPQLAVQAAHAARAATDLAEVHEAGEAHGPTGHGEAAVGCGGDEVRQAAGGAVWAAEAGAAVHPDTAMLAVGLAADGGSAAQLLAAAVRGTSALAADSPPPARLGEQFDDALTSDMVQTVGNRVVIVPASGEGCLDLLVDGVLFPSHFSALRVTPLVLQPGGIPATVSLMHCL